jgi:hypothetical protein
MLISLSKQGRMGFRRPTLASVVLAVLWLLCAIHCTVDKASAHWHIGGHTEAPVHHHSLSGEETPESGCPQHDSSHDSRGEECCSIQARLISLHAFERESLHPRLMASALGLIFSHAKIFLLHDERGPSPQPEAALRQFTFLSEHLRAACAPNAPPSNV